MRHLFLILFFLLYLFSCDNDSQSLPSNPVDQLPLPTQTGANTFGCLLDGEAFLPGNSPNPVDCVYQFVDGGYYFALQANKHINDDLVRLAVATENLQIHPLQTYTINEHLDGNVYGAYFKNISFSYTGSTSGELIITNLNTEENIVSGTFWYDIQDTQGIVHHIREGRFDMHYTE